MAEITSNLIDAIRPLPVSGTYASNYRSSQFVAMASLSFETVRLDVDGVFPQMMASGYYKRTRVSISKPAEWLAYPLMQIDASTWEGPIVQVWGDRQLIPHSRVRLHVPSYPAAYSPSLMVTFLGGPPEVQRVLDFVSPWFREVTFEFDRTEGSPQVTWIRTCAHADHPPSLRCENLKFEQVYDRAGVQVTQSRRRSTVPLEAAGADHEWSDQELNDAMHQYWSSYSDYPNWAIWVLFTNKHELTDDERKEGLKKSGLLGVMFDDSDQNQRQGVAVFNDTLAESVQEGYPQPNEHLARKRFFSLVHEVGHCLNLHHAFRGLHYDPKWQWPFYGDDPDEFTFMYYPERRYDFWSLFQYRFSDSELKFLRHAPEFIVQMGDEPFWGGGSGLTAHGRFSEPLWSFAVKLHRPGGVFEFLEPVTLTATLTNISNQCQIVDQSVLGDGDNFTMIIGLPDGRSRIWHPLIQRCYLPRARVLEPGQSISAKFIAGIGHGGWYISEPGAYTIQALLRTPQTVAVANPVRLRVAHSCQWDEELIAQDFFTADVARALAFGGTHTMTKAIETLREVAERLPHRAAAHHAALALAQPWMADRCRLQMRDCDGDRTLEMVAARHDEARRLFEFALTLNPERSAASFGKDAYFGYLASYADWLTERGDNSGAEKARSLRMGDADAVAQLAD